MSKSTSRRMTKKEQRREGIWMAMLMLGGPVGLIFIVIDMATNGKITDNW